MSTFSPIDQEVRERIINDLEANLSVEAGAGTGKTTVLVDRVAAILRSGRATVDQIAVITFTEAAAAELSGRLRQRLEKAREDTTDDAERERVATALGDLHRAHIETIHAFAAGLLRERPVEAGLDPGFEVLDDLQAGLAYAAAYDTWLRGVLSESRPQIAAAIRRGFNLKALRDLADAVHRNRHLIPLAGEGAPEGAPDLTARLAEIAERCGELMPLAARDEIGLTDMEAIVDFAARLAELEGNEPELGRAILFGAPVLKPTRGKQTDWDDPQDCRDSKELRAQARDAVAAAQAALRTAAIVDVLPLVEQFVRAYEARRKARGQADYHDLLAWARDLLADSPEARAYFRNRFRVLVVDEFQDTDPVQSDIILCLASDAEPGDDWLTMGPRPGALTVVGDPKQSIYRFRGADIAIYDAVRHGPLAGGDARMTQNFRSVAGVLNWANRVFDRVLVRQEGVQHENSPLVAGPARLGDESLSVTVLHGSPDADGAASMRAEEARLLALRIARAVGEGWPVRDRETGQERPAAWGDVVVLMPRRTGLEAYLDAFGRAGLPVRAEGGRSFFERQEVRDLANLLLAIDDPHDTVSLVASLRSIVFGCSDEEIYLHTVAGNRLDYRRDQLGEQGGVIEAMRILEDLHDLRSRVSLGQLVRVVLERTRLIEIALAGGDGPQSAANLVKLADRARAFSASGAGGLRAFAQWLIEKRTASDDAEAGIAEEGDDVVRVMTVHAAKGLEFPIVALANLNAASPNNVVPVPDRAAQRLHVSIKAGNDRFETPGFARAWEPERQQRDAEQRRLLYVAVTRARDHLIVPVACEPSTAKGMLATLGPFLPGPDPASPTGAQVDGCFVCDGGSLGPLPPSEPPRRATVPEPVLDAARAERDTWMHEREARSATAREALAVFPATADEGDEPLPAARAGADDGPLIAGGPTGSATAKGQAMHRALELLDLTAPGDIEGAARSMCILEGVEEAVDEVRAMVEACLAAPVVARARAARAVWNEVPYTLRVADGYATGRIDVVVHEGDHLVAVDWKSDSVGPGQVQAAAEGHRAQADAYVRALEATTGLPVEEVVFVFARAREEWALSPRRSGLDG